MDYSALLDELYRLERFGIKLRYARLKFERSGQRVRIRLWGALRDEPPSAYVRASTARKR